MVNTLDSKVDNIDSFSDELILDSFKEKTNELIQILENNDFEKAFACIKELNEDSDTGVYSIIGKLTRGLHDAIADLNIPSAGQSDNNKTQENLDRVMQVTDDAASKTLDMTEQGMSSIKQISDSARSKQDKLQSYLSSADIDAETREIMEDLSGFLNETESTSTAISDNFKEIVMAQNFQDLTSQSISKAIIVIKRVEGSLISLTQYTSLLEQLSNITSSGRVSFAPGETEELISNIDKLSETTESAEHLAQDDVDDLLSSLGF